MTKIEQRGRPPKSSALAGAAGLVLMVTACGAGAPQAVEDGLHLEARPGQTVSLTLSETASTGYQWQATVSAPSIVRFEGRSSLSSSAQAGGASRVRFDFTALAPGRAELRFDLQRAWEDAPIQTRTVTVTVND